MSPLLDWLIAEQEELDVTGLEIATTAEIAPQTWSKARQGKQDLTSDLLWRCMKAIAHHRPNSDVAKVVDIIEGIHSRKKHDESPLLQIEKALNKLESEEDEDQALLLLAKKLRKSTLKLLRA